MGIELTAKQLLILQETTEAKDPAEFDLLRVAAKPEIARIVREVLGPHQPIATTIIEVRDLYLTVHDHIDALDKVGFDAERRALFRDSIRLAATSDLWFSEGKRTGAYKIRTVEEIVNASRPWRAQIAVIAGHAFVHEPEIKELFEDVNSSGTVDEEIKDLDALNGHIETQKDHLVKRGLTAEIIAQGATLLAEARGRDLLGVLGIRSQDEAILLRNKLLTFAIAMAREARAAGMNGCFGDVEAYARFEAASFRDTLRRLKPSKRRSGAGEAQPEPQPAPVAGAPAPVAAPAAPAPAAPVAPAPAPATPEPQPA